MGDCPAQKKLRVGVLAIIGSFTEHVNQTERAAELCQSLPSHALRDVSVEVSVIRNPEQVNDDLDALIIPGGETTVLSRFLSSNNFVQVLQEWTSKPDKVTWGTCAGLIILSNKIENEGRSPPVTIGGIDITCVRNAYGRQKESHVVDLDLTNHRLQHSMSTSAEAQACTKFAGVFIRAPTIKSIDSKSVETLCSKPVGLDCETGSATQDGTSQPVGVCQGNKMATTFHPELADDLRWHAFFLQKALDRKYSFDKVTQQ